MRAGRAIRVAALVTAGLMSAAVVAPGIASAATTSTCTAEQTLDASGQCVPLSGSSSTTGTGTTTDTTTSVPTTTEQVPTTSGGAVGSSGTGTSSGAASSGASSSAAPSSGDSTGITGAGTGAAVDPAAPAVGNAKAVADTPAAVSDAASALTGSTAAGTTFGDVLGKLPPGNLTGLGTIPTLPDTGTFESPKDACLYLASKVNAPEGQAAALGGQFASFCGSLPPSFSGLDLTGLITKLTDLLKGLEATRTHPGSTNTTPIHTSWGDLPASFHDLDCGQLSYDEAQAVLASDPSDPNHLDGDHDGEACERNPHDYAKVCDTYDGYPVGAVATGDSAPAVVPGAAAALGALALAALAGAAPLRGRDTEDEPDDADIDSDVEADLATAGPLTAEER